MTSAQFIDNASNASKILCEEFAALGNYFSKMIFFSWHTICCALIIESPTKYGRVFGSFLLPESIFNALSPEKARPWNPKRRCLWLLKRKPRRKPKRKRSKYGVVGLWWWFKPSLLSGKQGNRSGYLIHRALQWQLGGPCVFGRREIQIRSTRNLNPSRV